MIITLGPYTYDTDKPETMPIGYLRDTAGNAIVVFRYNIVTAWSDATGSPPGPPGLEVPHPPEPIYGTITYNTGAGDVTDQIITSYFYDPGPNDINTALNNQYATAVTAWNDHAQMQEQILQLLLSQLKPAGKA